MWEVEEYLPGMSALQEERLMDIVKVILVLLYLEDNAEIEEVLIEFFWLESVPNQNVQVIHLTHTSGSRV